MKARALPACVLFRDGELPGCRWPDFNFSCLPLQQLLLMLCGFLVFLFVCFLFHCLVVFFFPATLCCCRVRYILRAYACGCSMLAVQLRCGVDGGMKNVGAALNLLQFQETWKIRQLIAKSGVGLNTTQMLRNVYYLNFSILLECCSLGITGYKSVTPRVPQGGNVPTGCCSPCWRLWVAKCWFAVEWWF